MLSFSLCRSLALVFRPRTINTRSMSKTINARSITNLSPLQNKPNQQLVRQSLNLMNSVNYIPTRSFLTNIPRIRSAIESLQNFGHVIYHKKKTHDKLSDKKHVLYYILNHPFRGSLFDQDRNTIKCYKNGKLIKYITLDYENRWHELYYDKNENRFSGSVVLFRDNNRICENSIIICYENGKITKEFPHQKCYKKFYYDENGKTIKEIVHPGLFDE